MYKRRRQAASPVSLLVVTLLSMWACSSGDHGDTSVTTSGGVGSRGGRAGVAIDLSPSLEAPGEGGVSEAGTAMSVDPASVAGDGGSGPLLSQAGSDESDATRGDYAGEAGAGGASSSAGGMTSSKGGASSGKGGAGAGGNSAGSGSAGAPFVGPVCAPTAALAAASELYLPCEVNSALYVCRTCHANPPLKPASTSYVTYADIKPRAAAIYDMVRTGYMPRPPYHLSEQQKVIVMTWLGLDGSCAVGVSSPCQ